jgi:hypothetical protein
MLGEAIVGAITITLDLTAKAARDQFIQTLRLSSRVPLSASTSALLTPGSNSKELQLRVGEFFAAGSVFLDP